MSRQVRTLIHTARLSCLNFWENWNSSFLPFTHARKNCIIVSVSLVAQRATGWLSLWSCWKQWPKQVWKWINPDGLRFVRCCLEQCRDASCDCAEIEKRKGVVKIGVKIDPFRYTSAGSGGVEKEDGLQTVCCKGATQTGLIWYIPSPTSDGCINGVWGKQKVAILKAICRCSLLFDYPRGCWSEVQLQF